MPSVRYFNQTAPFWDFVANLEENGARHPFFAGHGETDGEQQERPSWGGWGFGGQLPHRGRHGPPPHGPPPPPGPPPPGGHEGHHSAPPPPPEYNEDSKEEDGQPGPSHPRGPPPADCDAKAGWGFRSRGGRRGGCRNRGFRHGPPHHGPPPFFHPLAQMFQGQLFGDEESKEKSEDFKPEADVFDTAESFVVHVSLPGAKKEDVGVSWDAERSELTIAGVIYRPGDEEFLKTLALDERNIGAFERKVRLGSRANPAQVDVDVITAKMEDGVLTVEVPKLDSGYVEIKKVDIE